MSRARCGPSRNGRAEPFTWNAQLIRPVWNLGGALLIDLHHTRWQAGGESGVFREASFMQFHERLMRLLLERGDLELLWLRVRDEPVAALYGIRAVTKSTPTRQGDASMCRRMLVWVVSSWLSPFATPSKRVCASLTYSPMRAVQAAIYRHGASLVQLRVARPGWRSCARHLEWCVAVTRPWRGVSCTNMVEFQRLLR